jgi:hypothetical protein
MVDNIKIVGNITDTQQVTRYDANDINLLTPQTILEDFGQSNDYIEYFVYDIGNNLLKKNYSYKNFKSPSTSTVTPLGNLPLIEIDPILDLKNLGYVSGEFKVQYNFFGNKISNSSAELFLKEISSNRTELRVGSTILTNSQIEASAIELINEYTKSSYFVDYLINFDNNIQVTAVNVALNKLESGYEILFKLYQPLPENIQEKSTLWVVKERINPYIFNINLDKLVIQAPLPQLRGPNFDIEISNQNNIATSYQDYTNLINSVQNLSTSSYQQLLSLITSQSININVDYSDYNNFSLFSSTKQRIINFYNKVKQIEDYKKDIVIYTAATSSLSSNFINSSTSSINDIITGFDGFEYYLYFESGSVTSSLEYGITPFPKSTSSKPFELYSTSSALSNTWFNTSTSSADLYDGNNQNYIINTLPTFIKDDENNAQYITFVNMVGHYFDNIWIYLQAITDVNKANNNLNQGISKDLVYYVLQSLGTKLYNQYGDSDNTDFLIGNSGSINFDNNFTYTGSYLNAIPHKDLLAESYKRIYHNLPLLLKTKGTTYGLQTLISTFGVTGSVLGIKEYGGDIKSGLLDEFNNDKVRVISNNITGSVLSPFISLQTYPTSSTQFRTNDLHYVDISFSPQEKIDIFASASIAASASATWSLDDFIGDPRAQYSGSYPTLEVERQTYYSPLTASIVPFSSSVGIEYINATDYNSFIRLIQFFDNSLFKMLQDFVPARVNLSTGVTIASPVLERNKWSYANPSSTSEINVNEGTIDGIEISTEYTNLYSKLSGSKAAYYDGNITGSYINVYKYFESSSINPYLIGSTGSWNAQHTITESANLNKFLHSDFNVLLNNVSSSLTSSIRQDIQYVFGTTQSILSPAELQDSYESLITHQLSRYEGVKLSSLTYNTYTSASSTYNGDISFGKTAAIDHNSRKLGLFTDVVSSSYLPGRNNVRLLYLVDEFGSLTELNLRNKHWQEVQNTFIQGTTLDVSQFDNQKFSNQKTTDGTKDIFDSGYTYSPILYFPTCSANDKIYFQFNGSSNSYLSLANTSGTGSKTINGFSTNNYPLSASEVYNIFDSVTLGGNYLKQGTLSLYPTYSVQEGGNHKVSGSLTMTVVIPEGGTSTWNLGVYKNGISTGVSSTQVFDIGSASTASLYPYTSSQSFAITSGFSNQTEVYVQEVFSNKWIRLGGNDYPPNTPFYRYYIALYSNYTIGGGGYCNLPVEYYLGNDWYSLNNLDRYTGDRDIISCDNLYSYNFLSSFWSIPDFNTPTGPQTKTFNIDSSTINADKNDILSIRFKNTVSSSNNFTASFDNIGSLFISSLSVSTGYADTSCPYFNSASMAISSSITGSDSVIIFDDALSSFYGDGYTFVPNPLTGSINTLYGTYGDVDYPFLIKPQDILIVYLSDGTYVESRILEVTGGGTSSLRIKLDAPLSTLLRSDLTVGSGAYRSFLILSRIEDETSAYLTFKKRDGKTSYGFIIPNDIAPDILNNIDIITKEVKQKLINEQSAIDSISGGTFG